jgi:hypothetical protein
MYAIEGATGSHFYILWKSIKQDGDVDTSTGPPWLKEMFEWIKDCMPVSVYEPQQTFPLFRKLLEDAETEANAERFKLLPLCTWRARNVSIFTTALVMFAQALEPKKTVKKIKKDPSGLHTQS